MTDQIHQPARPLREPRRAHFEASDDLTASHEWRAQINQLLEDYRNRYVLRPQGNEKPSP